MCSCGPVTSSYLSVDCDAYEYFEAPLIGSKVSKAWKDTLVWSRTNLYRGIGEKGSLRLLEYIPSLYDEKYSL